MQRLPIDTWRADPTTVVFVTHDVDEALLIGDRIAVRRPRGPAAARLLDVTSPRDPAAFATYEPRRNRIPCR